ncbi:MAG: YraN family protein [Bacteroidales bacterium]|nr:YraN family protein [Bacteroidales bacterium]
MNKRKTMKESTYIKGRKGENLATEYLMQKGYRIMQRNVTFKKNEIDIIAIDKNEIVFVEVKERATDVFGSPYEKVDRKKQELIIKVADNYIIRNNINLEARFDIVSIVDIDSEEPKIEHIIDAFSPCDFI